MEINFIDYLFDDLLKKSDLTSSEGKADLIDSLLPIVFSNPNWFEQDRYLQKLADATGITKDQLRMIAGSCSRRQMRRVYPEVESVFAIASEDPLETRAITLLLQNVDIWDYRFDLKIDFLKHEANRAILSAIHAESTLIGAKAKLDEQFKERWMHLSQLELPPADEKLRYAEWEACVGRLKKRYLRNLKSLERAALDNGGDDSESAVYIENVQRQAIETNKRLRELFNDERNL